MMRTIRSFVIRVYLSVWAYKAGSRLLIYLREGRSSSDAKRFVDELIEPFEMAITKALQVETKKKKGGK